MEVASWASVEHAGGRPALAPFHALQLIRITVVLGGEIL